MANVKDQIKELEALVKATKPKPPSVAAEIVMHTEKVAENCVDRMREVYAVIMAAYTEAHQGVAVLTDKTQQYTSAQLVDTIFAIKECKAQMEQLEKELNGLLREAMSVVCGRWLSDPMASERIEGQFANGFPEVKNRASVPRFSHEPELYQQIYNWLGIPEDLQDKGEELVEEGKLRTKVVELDYIGFNQMLDKYEYAGHALPDFIQKWRKFEEKNVRTRRTQDLL